MSELNEIMNGKQEMRGFRIEGDTIGFDTLKSANWNLSPRDIENIIYTLQQEIERLHSIIKEAREFVESMEYCGQEDYFYDKKASDPCGNDNTFNDSKYKLIEILDRSEKNG